MGISRRTLLNQLIAATSSATVWRPSLYAALTGSGDFAAKHISPRQHLLLDRNWRFSLGSANDSGRDFGFEGFSSFSKQAAFKFALPTFDDAKWRSLNLPHDWTVELQHVNDDHNDGEGFFPLGRKYPNTSIGWYRRTFSLPPGTEGKRIVLDFDGIYHASRVFVNGSYLGIHEAGYAPSSYDITDFLNYQGKNTIAVRVDASFGDGWFYQGAGIYRHAWLTITNQLFLKPWETTVRHADIGESVLLQLASVAANRDDSATSAAVRWDILDPSGKLVTSVTSKEGRVDANGEMQFAATVTVHRPELWTPASPHLYKVIASLLHAGAIADREECVFGIRTIEFTADRGMLLNGRPIKLKGVCNHQDHACVGSALPNALQSYRTRLLLDMGCNAVRTSHNYPTPELIDACDRLGMMVMCETRTFSTSSEGQDQLADMVRRFRNHPSVVLWSLGNEERIQGTDEGERIAHRNQSLVHALDPTRKCTMAMHLDWGKGISKVIDVQGFNYHFNDIDRYHQAHPNQPSVGTETASLVSTRGIYANDPKHNWVNAYDINKTDKGLSHASTAEQWWKFYAERDFLAGGFAWTGFDYRGEPTPYRWPSTNSQFGIMDLCGFPKDEFFYYKAWWGTSPILHLFPHWNWNEPGDLIQIWAFCNLDAVELFVNEVSHGLRTVTPLGHLEWRDIPYQPGFIEARAMKGGKVVLTTRRETTGAPAALRLSADRQTIDADGEDIAVLTVEVLDDRARVVPLANVDLHFEFTGPGALLGLGNGDPNCLEPDKATSHTSFNGLAQAIVQSSCSAGVLALMVSSPGLTSARISVNTSRTVLRPSLD